VNSLLQESGTRFNLIGAKYSVHIASVEVLKVKCPEGCCILSAVPLISIDLVSHSLKEDTWLCLIRAFTFLKLLIGTCCWHLCLESGGPTQ
jgi:hypothetical protein